MIVQKNVWNMFTYAIEGRPKRKEFKGLFANFKYKKAEKSYYNWALDHLFSPEQMFSDRVPIIIPDTCNIPDNYCRAHIIKYEILSDFSDFLKINEISNFYQNTLDNLDHGIRIVTENSISAKNDNKSLIVYDKDRRVLITIQLEIDHGHSEDENTYQKINVIVENQFGKKAETKFKLIDYDIPSINQTQYELLNNVMQITANCMVEAFKQIYNLK